MRIVAGQWRGRALAAPPGRTTRPTADRVRQALFDMLLHAPWSGGERMAHARVLDGFAGTGALGLEALSRGAPHCVFFETDRTALAVLRANIAACGARDRATVRAGDVTRPPPAAQACDLLLLDPPYGQGLPERTLAALARTGWIAPGALIVIETGAEEPLPTGHPILEAAPLAERRHGAARLSIWRAAGAPPQ
ncbi:N-6 adenine-specific DNA methylase [Gluconacetobacter sacchari DSM 12717]|uniref:16S rRNA (Guanine(966)-N(2))-methyltransferase RsmD n=2 Tax=Gluconacetobacter sacchari TaxID=92759 RepID=A0A7W4NKQ2_9PROT|nr:16S rRNA (guanine(966)-N(2))-methyltransferase RsmD [Gluconacetobacter sacchari]MBB2159554.1 16S rRNA (guanine(966)-N(2))-methyltransferase RsmD [Gluconacetobacter sacchari]GBQ20857.1 N-6 adenine-specific DNA methylase [Gluconacetobacter sacchari DSM 12717]